MLKIRRDRLPKAHPVTAVTSNSTKRYYLLSEYWRRKPDCPPYTHTLHSVNNVEALSKNLNSELKLHSNLGTFNIKQPPMISNTLDDMNGVENSKIFLVMLTCKEQNIYT